jgi:hypothetical protein
MTQYFDPRGLGLEIDEINGFEVTTLCPFHDDHHPSATFNMRTGLFHCFQCGVGMNANQVAHSLGTRAARIDMPLSGGVKRREQVEWRNVLNAPLAIDNPYLHGRGITNASVVEYQIRDVGYGVAFPNLMPNGTVIGAQIRRYDGEPRYIFVGSRSPVWPITPMLKTGTVYVVEGVFGALKGLQAGFQTVAVMGASAIHAANRLLNGRPTASLFDNDFAGYLGMAKLLYLRGARAHIPGAEVDEMNVDQWRAMVESHDFTISISDLRDLSQSCKRFDELMLRFMGR